MSTSAIEESASTASPKVRPDRLGQLIDSERRSHYAAVARAGRRLKVAEARHEDSVDDVREAIRAAKDYLSVDDLASLTGLSRPEIYQVLSP